MTTAPTSRGFGRSLDHWLGDPAHAEALAMAYLNPDRYSGALWDPAAARRRVGEAAFVIDVEDLYAPTLLSAPIERAAGKDIVGRSDQITQFLVQIPVGLKLWDPTSGDVNAGLKAADDLIRALDKVPNIGPTKASKLVAAKRPNLIPIWDKQVAAALIEPPKMTWSENWEAWREALDANSVSRLEGIAAAAGRPELSPLRMADIIIWMAQHGFNNLLPDDYPDLRARCVRDLASK